MIPVRDTAEKRRHAATGIVGGGSIASVPVRLRYPIVVFAALVVGLGSAECDDEVLTCAPTVLRASDAAEGAVLEVSLRSGDLPVRDKTVRFEVRAGDVTLLTTTAEVDETGAATVDLSGRDVLADADRYVATFAGDNAFCDSSDSARITGNI